MSSEAAPPGSATDAVGSGDAAAASRLGGLASLRERRLAAAAADATRSDTSAESVRVLYEAARGAMFANLAALAAFALIASPAADVLPLRQWTVATVVVLALRFMHVHLRSRGAAFPSPVDRLHNEFGFGVFVTGACFGIGYLLFAGALDTHQRLLLVLTTAGISAGAGLSLATSRRAFFGYATGSLGVSTGYAVFAASKDPTLANMAEAYILIAFFAVLSVLHAGAYRFATQALRLNIENTRMLESLARHRDILAREREVYRTESLTDALTGVANRRSFDDALERYWAEAGRRHETLACALIDIDYFKQYNDAEGHAAGDACLARVATAVNSVARRGGDFFARYGGEEFVLLVPSSHEAGALFLADKARRAVLDLALPHPTSPIGVVTVSIGAATLSPASSGHLAASAIVELADQALYEAKRAGRNRVELAQREESPTLEG